MQSHACLIPSTQFLEPIQPDFPWQPSLGITALPEAQLLFSLIQASWDDANSPKYTKKRLSARRWFFTDQFTEFCQYLGLNLEAIRDNLYNRWRKK